MSTSAHGRGRLGRAPLVIVVLALTAVLGSGCKRIVPEEEVPAIPSMYVYETAIPRGAASAAAQETLALYDLATSFFVDVLAPAESLQPLVEVTDEGTEWHWSYTARGLAIEIAVRQSETVFFWTLRATGRDSETGLNYDDFTILDLTTSTFESTYGVASIYRPDMSGPAAELLLTTGSLGTTLTYTSSRAEEGTLRLVVGEEGGGNIEQVIAGIVRFRATFQDRGKGDAWTYDAQGLAETHRCWDDAGNEARCL